VGGISVTFANEKIILINYSYPRAVEKQPSLIDNFPAVLQYTACHPEPLLRGICFWDARCNEQQIPCKSRSG
jgi:hypothetical protein